MRHPHRAAFRDPATSLRRQSLQDGGLPFTDVLTREGIEQAPAASNTRWLDRIFSPLVTPWAFLGQALSGDQSCRAAVARLIARRVARGQKPCGSRTGAYCQARERLPERPFAAAARPVGRNPDARVDQRWLWKGRRVCPFDGTTASLPDTPRNRAEHPLTCNQVPGTDFALARVGAVIALPCGATLAPGICRHTGKGQGGSACPGGCGTCCAPATCRRGTA